MSVLIDPQDNLLLSTSGPIGSTDESSWTHHPLQRRSNPDAGSSVEASLFQSIEESYQAAAQLSQPQDFAAQMDLAFDSAFGSNADSRRFESPTQPFLTEAGVLTEAMDSELDPLLSQSQDDSLETAQAVGILSGTSTYSDAIGGEDRNDYYRFTLDQASSFSLSLEGLSADADVQLLNGSGLVIDASYGLFSQAESIQRSLNAGEYYVRVYPYSGVTNYDLSLTAEALSLSDGAGNTWDAARNLGVLTETQTLKDSVGGLDTNDYYRFSLDEARNFSLNVTGLSSDVDVQLQDSSGRVLRQSLTPGFSPEAISASLEAGTYYVRVYPYQGESNYQLELSASAITDGFSFSYGYGMVDAAAAVAIAAGQATSFEAIADLGGNNWGNDLVNAPEAWASGYSGEGVVVAVIDSGVDITHSDLQDNIWRNSDEIAGNGIDDDGNGYIDDVFGWNFGLGQNNNNVLPGTSNLGQGHGTHVAGTIAAANDGIGLTGVAYDAEIMAIRMGDVRNGTFVNAGDLAQAIRYAVDNGADVINMSLGWPDSPELQEALAYAASRNVITVTAAGNSRLAAPGNPASYATQYGISVGAVDRDLNLAFFSNQASTNSELHHVVAPGVDIYSTTFDGDYGFSNGTSMAAPHVAGVVALMLSANPDLTHDEVRQILAESSFRLV